MTTSINSQSTRVFARRALASCLAIVATSALLITATPAVAQVAATPAVAVVQDLDDVTVPINVTVVPGQPIDLFFTEPFDTLHHKDMLFQGIAHGPVGAVGILGVQFDWLNTAGQFELSPVFPVDVIGDTPFSIGWSVPFCPQEISLHLTNQGPVPGFPIVIDGSFSYRCVPEPASIVMGLMGAAALGAVVIRRRRARG